MLNDTITVNDGVSCERTYTIIFKSDGVYIDAHVKHEANKLADSIYENVSGGFLTYLVNALNKNQME